MVEMLSEAADGPLILLYLQHVLHHLLIESLDFFPVRGAVKPHEIPNDCLHVLLILMSKLFYVIISTVELFQIISISLYIFKGMFEMLKRTILALRYAINVLAQAFIFPAVFVCFVLFWKSLGCSDILNSVS